MPLLWKRSKAGEAQDYEWLAFVVPDNEDECTITMSNGTRPTAPLSVKPATLRVRRHRERRRKGLCSFTIDMPKVDIEDAIARGILKPNYDAWDVLDSWYADHLSDAALEWQ